MAQEVLKAASKQFTPINQWYYIYCIECRADDYQSTVDSDIYQPIGSRYDGQIIKWSRIIKEFRNARSRVVTLRKDCRHRYGFH